MAERERGARREKRAKPSTADRYWRSLLLISFFFILLDIAKDHSVTLNWTRKQRMASKTEVSFLGWMGSDDYIISKGFFFSGMVVEEASHFQGGSMSD